MTKGFRGIDVYSCAFCLPLPPSQGAASRHRLRLSKALFGERCLTATEVPNTPLFFTVSKASINITGYAVIYFKSG